MSPQCLIIGFGNRERGDDGVAFHVINRLRARCGVRPLAEGRWPPQALCRGIDTAFARQLVPELAADVGGYRRLILVDAHVHAEPRGVVCARIEADPRPSALSHVLPPETFLWLVQGLCGRTPATHMVSVRGHRFGPTRRLSAASAAWVDPACEAIAELAGLAAPAGAARALGRHTTPQGGA